MTPQQNRPHFDNVCIIGWNEYLKVHIKKQSYVEKQPLKLPSVIET